MTRSSIKRPVTTCMVVLVVLMLGLVAYNNLDLEFMPSVDLPVAMVMTQYRGAGPEEVEELVTKPIESTLSTLTGVDTITSQSSEGSSMVVVMFVDGTDLDTAVNDMRDKMEGVTRMLPDDAEDPSIMKMDMDASTFNIGVTSDNMDIATLYDYVDENVTNYFERLEGIASVSLNGGVDKEIQIMLSPEKMSRYGLTISSVSQALAQENQDTSAGTLKQGSQDMTMRVAGSFEDIEDIKNIYISTSGGNGLLLKDIADSIKEVELDRDRIAIINGSEGISLEVSLASDGNLVEISDKILETIDELEQKFPNLHFTMLSTTSDYIKNSIHNVVNTSFQAAIIAVLVLLFFLQNWKSALVIGISIPTSIMATFGVMYVLGMTMNIKSMGGVVIGIGMLVDNSVVVLENIYNFKTKGFSASEAAYYGTKEVALAVAASTLTTVAVFAPFLFIGGTMGQMLKDICVTICVALLASYAVSVTFVPSACAFLMANDDRERVRPKKVTVFTRIGRKINGALDRLDHAYSRLVNLCLKHRIITVIAVVIVFIASLMSYFTLDMDLMTQADEGSLSVTARIPEGYDFDYSYGILEEMMEKIGDIPETESSFAMVGGSNVMMMYNLVSSDERDRSTDEIVEEIKEKVKDIAGAEITASSGSMAMGSFGGAGSFTLTIYGDETETLRQISDDLIEKIEKIDGAYNVRSSMDDGTIQTDIIVDRAKAANYGISSAAIASAVNTSNSGTVGTTLKSNGIETDIRVMYPEDYIEYVKDLYSMTVKTGTGAEIPLTEVADISVSEVPQRITRENQQRFINITGSITGMSTSEVQTLISDKISDYVFPENYRYEFGGLQEYMDEAFKDLFTVIVVAIILVFMIMASQFESLIQPTIVMFSMPISITGGMLGLFLTGMNITSYAYMGFIMLVGMVVNNAIVLVDYTNQRRLEHGMSCHEALVEAGRSRLRPILMTTLTTVLGMVPMALALSEGMETQQSMGVVIIFGLTLSTLVTLVFIPVVYSLADSLLRRMRRISARFSPYADALDDKYDKAVKAYREKENRGMY